MNAGPTCKHKSSDVVRHAHRRTKKITQSYQQVQRSSGRNPTVLHDKKSSVPGREVTEDT